jgi:uncharacterized linocin/CFP29 family protein
MLYRNLAPISNEAWEEIDERAAEVLKSQLTGRKVVSVSGPHGRDHTVISEGRLVDVEQKGNVHYANYEVLPLTEARIEFSMKRWELDNVIRGAKDVDYAPLEEAAKELARFEEEAIFNGLESAIIKGIDGEVSGEAIKFGDTPSSMLEALTKGVIKLREAFAERPYTLVASPEVYTRIMSQDTGYPFAEKVKSLIGGDILLNHVIDGAYLLPKDHEDLEFTIGRDFEIGYQAHDIESVRFFMTESFTFRVLDPEIIVKYNL